MPEEGSLYTLPLPISLPKHLQLATASPQLLPEVDVYSEPVWQFLYPPGNSLVDGALGSRGISWRDAGLTPRFVTSSPMQSQQSPSWPLFGGLGWCN